METTSVKTIQALRWFDSNIPLSFAVVVILGIAMTAMTSRWITSGRGDDKSSEVWIEKQQLQTGDWWCNGPTIFRAKHRPLFFLHEVSNKSLELDKYVPFIIVIDVKDSMEVLSEITSLRAGSWGSDPKSSGRFRMSDGEIVAVSQWFELQKDDDGKISGLKTMVRIGHTIDDSIEHVFDQEQGRAISIKYDETQPGFVIKQHSIELPSAEIFHRLSGMDSHDPANYEILHDWWNSAVNEK